MTGPRRVGKTALLLLHAESLAEHGGLEGMRDEGLLDSALARPLNVQAYEASTIRQDLPRPMHSASRATIPSPTATSTRRSSRSAWFSA
jgi:hypothetical protein